jgi:hypothetical protein
VATDDGSVGNLVAAVVNTTADDEVLNVQVEAASGKITDTVRVPAHSVSSLGENVDPLRLENLGVKPGHTVAIYFQSGSAEGAQVNVPVLDGGEEYLTEFVPTPAPTETATPAS